MFGVSYGTALLVGAGAEEPVLFAPVVGPALLDDEPILYLWSAVQAAGLIMTVLGLVLRRRVPIYAEHSERRFALAPYAAPDGRGGANGGLILSGAF